MAVLTDQTLALVGGDVNLQGGGLEALSGHLELGSVGPQNTVGLFPVEEGWRFNYDDVETYRDISLSEFAQLNTNGLGSGSINVQGQNITFAGGSQLLALTVGSDNGQDIRITASEALNLITESAFQVASVDIGLGLDLGASGNIFLVADSLNISEGSLIFAPGVNGQASNIIIKTNQIDLSGVNSDGGAGGIFADVFSTYDENLKGGNIDIETENLVVRDGAQISLTTSGAASSGDLIINASQAVEIRLDPNAESNRGTGLFNQVRNAAAGNAGEISLITGRLLLQGGGQIESSTFGSGNGGLINIKAVDIVGSGRTSDGRIPSGIVASVGEGEQSFGSAGTLNINTQRLTLLDGAQIATAARNEGAGEPLTVNASEFILLDGIFIVDENVSTNSNEPENLSRNSSGIFVSAEPGATNLPGILDVTTDTLRVENGAKISADNFGSGRRENNDLRRQSDANINVRQLFIRDGGRVGAGSLVDPDDPNFDSSQLGSGGQLTINAAEKIEISGQLILDDETINSELFTRAEGSGPAGDLIINETDNGNLTVIVSDEAEISASTLSSTGGNIKFNNPDIVIVRDQARISAITNGSDPDSFGGNIEFNNSDVVLLRTGGQITTQADRTQGAGNGGNITLNMPNGFVVTVPDENSDIVANAFGGDGGNINITAQGIFNLVERPAIDGNGTNDIDASSQFGQSGTVVINNPNLDPTRNLAELPTETTPSTVAQRCLADSEGQSAFVVTGQGGAPPTPIDIVHNESAGLIDLGNDGIVTRTEESHNIAITSSSDQTELPQLLIEAQGWQRDQAGNVVLMAQIPNPAPAVDQYTTVCTSTRG